MKLVKLLLGRKFSRSKRKLATQVRTDEVGAVVDVDRAIDNNEPWMILAHKKPQKHWVPYNPRKMRPPALSADTKSVKLVSWNVNGLRALLKMEGFSALELAQREDFDVLCLQETKLQDSILFLFLFYLTRSQSLVMSFTVKC